jgi:hypothetical protein
MSKYLDIEFKPLAEIGVLITGDEAKKQINRKYEYGQEYSIKLKDHTDCEKFTPMHLNNCFVMFSTGDSLAERFNTCKVPIAINVDQAEELESCIEEMVNALEHLDQCARLTDSSMGSIHELVCNA